MKINNIISTICLVVFSSCLNTYYKYNKPRQINLPEIKTTTYLIDSSKTKYIYFLQHNNKYISNCYLFLLDNQSVYFVYDYFLKKELIKNNHKVIETEINRISKEDWQRDYLFFERWGFYNIQNDTITIQYFKYIGPVFPTSTRIAELRGRILPDSTIEIERSIFRKPNGELYDVGGHDTTFNPPLRFIKYNTTFIPDFTKSVLYRSVWYQNYLQTKPD